MELLPDEIEVKTEFGKLIVPVRQIRRIEFGLHYPEGVEKKIDAAIKKLASAQYKDAKSDSTSGDARGLRLSCADARCQGS